MDGYWRLFLYTGNPAFYLLHRQQGRAEIEGKTA